MRNGGREKNAENEKLGRARKGAKQGALSLSLSLQSLLGLFPLLGQEPMVDGLLPRLSLPSFIRNTGAYHMLQRNIKEASVERRGACVSQ